jgi:predicted Zn-dependent peptidase
MNVQSSAAFMPRHNRNGAMTEDGMKLRGSGVEITRLSNGFTIVTEQIPHVETAALGIWLGSGSRDETQADHGISHFLEHMLFKGTRRRSARQLAEEIEAVGGEINAATGIETTGYFARMMGADCGLALELIADLLLDPLIAEADIERERSVILQEMAADGDEPEDMAHDMLQATAFAGQALGRPIIGTRESVNAIGRAALLRHLERVRRAPAAVLSAAGAVDHAQLARQAEALFSSLPNSATEPRHPAQYHGGRQILAEPFEQTHLLIGFAAPGRKDLGAANTAAVLADILGGGASSRLFQNIREERGLCYAVDADAARFADAGVFSIYAATRAEAVTEVVGAIADELSTVLESGITPGELAGARARMRMGLRTMVESAGALAEHLGHEILEFGRVRPHGELLAAVDAVDGAAIRHLAGQIFQQSEPILVEVGSALAEPALDRIDALRDPAQSAHLRGIGKPWHS